MKKELPGMESFFLALADKTRLRLLNLMRGGEVCVGNLVEILGESQPKISRHLAFLRNAGIVEARRDGKWIHYRITEPKDEYAAQVLENTLVWLNRQEPLQSEYEKLTKILHSTGGATIITSAPAQHIFAKSNMIKNQRRELEVFML